MVFADKKAAFLIENGFCEREYAEVQSIFEELGISSRIISSEVGLLTAWNKLDDPKNSYWGQKYASDYKLESVSPSQFDILVLPGGRRSSEKLQLDKGVKSFISGFVVSGKPILAYNLAHDVLAFYDLLQTYHISNYQDEKESNITSKVLALHEDGIVKSRNLISLSGYDHDKTVITSYIKAILEGDLSEFDPSPTSIDQGHKAA